MLQYISYVSASPSCHLIRYPNAAVKMRIAGFQSTVAPLLSNTLLLFDLHSTNVICSTGKPFYTPGSTTPQWPIEKGSKALLTCHTEGSYPTFSLNATDVPTAYPLSYRLSSTLSSSGSGSSASSSTRSSSASSLSRLSSNGTQTSGISSVALTSTGSLSIGAQSSGVLSNGATFTPLSNGASGILPSNVIPSGVFPSGVIPYGVFPSGIGPPGAFPTASGRPVLNSAQSASYRSFRKQEACTLSLSSFLAGGMTSSLNSYWESTSDDGSVYAAHTPYTVFYKTTTNKITVSTTTLGPDDSCCGTCDVDYPQADILYWPVSTQNTWCLQFGATIPPPITIGTVDGSILPAVLPAPTGLPVASGLDKRAGPSRLRLQRHQNTYCESVMQERAARTCQRMSLTP